MDTTQTLGVLAHRGGLLVKRPELTVGMVQAVSRPSGLTIDLLARRPLDRRSATERQHDIRSGRGIVPVAPRRLLPAADGGTDLRVGWLDPAGRPRWEFGYFSSDSGDHYQGTAGPSSRTIVTLPPQFDQLSLILAFPEIGFPETVITLPLPDQATVERETTSIWLAPMDVARTAESLNHRIATVPAEVAIEAGSIVATSRVLHRGEHAAVVLTRLTAVDAAQSTTIQSARVQSTGILSAETLSAKGLPTKVLPTKVLSMEVLSVATGDPAESVGAAFPPHRASLGPYDNAEQIRANGRSATIAVVRGGDAYWLTPGGGSTVSGRRTFFGTQEIRVDCPDDGILELVVAWPIAGLHDVRVRIPLDEH